MAHLADLAYRDVERQGRRDVSTLEGPDGEQTLTCVTIWL
jgi:hypothetical protein